MNILEKIYYQFHYRFKVMLHQYKIQDCIFLDFAY